MTIFYRLLVLMCMLGICGVAQGRMSLIWPSAKIEVCPGQTVSVQATVTNNGSASVYLSGVQATVRNATLPVYSGSIFASSPILLTTDASASGALVEFVVPPASVTGEFEAVVVLLGGPELGDSEILDTQVLLIAVRPLATIDVQPLDNSVAVGANVTFDVAASNGALTYQWRKGGMDLTDGPTGNGSVVSGATTAALTILNAQESDSGTYDCVVGNSCGQAESDAAVLVVEPAPLPCPGDFNRDEVVDLIDLLDFVSVWSANLGLAVPPGESVADINGDEAVDLVDLLDFVSEWSQNLGVTCP